MGNASVAMVMLSSDQPQPKSLTTGDNAYAQVSMHLWTFLTSRLNLDHGPGIMWKQTPSPREQGGVSCWLYVLTQEVVRSQSLFMYIAGCCIQCYSQMKASLGCALVMIPRSGLLDVVVNLIASGFRVVLSSTLAFTPSTEADGDFSQRESPCTTCARMGQKQTSRASVLSK